MTTRLRTAVAALIAILIGVLVWIAGEVHAGVKEGWDDPAYWKAGYPAMAFAAAVADFIQPRRVWRWPVLMMLSQFLVMFVQHPIGPLFLFGVIVCVVLAVPLTIGACIGALLSPVRRASAS